LSAVVEIAWRQFEDGMGREKFDISLMHGTKDSLLISILAKTHIRKERAAVRRGCKSHTSNTNISK
jgi:hypothetical protein